MDSVAEQKQRTEPVILGADPVSLSRHVRLLTADHASGPQHDAQSTPAVGVDGCSRTPDVQSVLFKRDRERPAAVALLALHPLPPHVRRAVPARELHRHSTRYAICRHRPPPPGRSPSKSTPARPHDAAHQPKPRVTTPEQNRPRLTFPPQL